VPVARALLDDKMPVHHQRLQAGERAVATVGVPPARLDAADARLGQVRDGLSQEGGLGDKIGVQDGDQLAPGGAQAGGQGPGLVPGAHVARQVDDLEALPPQAIHGVRDELARLVGRVVEHLHLEPVARVVEGRDGVQEAPGGVFFVIDRQLEGDGGPVPTPTPTLPRPTEAVGGGGRKGARPRGRTILLPPRGLGGGD